MAVSPLVMPVGPVDQTKSLKKAPPQSRPIGEASENGGGDLAEQMNDAEKKKYVKGQSLRVISPLHLLTSYRQETRRRYICKCLPGTSRKRSYQARRDQEDQGPGRVYGRNGPRCHPGIEALARTLSPEYHQITLSIFIQRPESQSRPRIPAPGRPRNVDQRHGRSTIWSSGHQSLDGDAKSSNMVLSREFRATSGYQAKQLVDCCGWRG